jgi:hypothetical protein
MEKNRAKFVEENDNKEVKDLLLKYIAKSRKFRYKLIRFFFYYKRSFVLVFFLLLIALFVMLFVLLSGFAISRITEIFSIIAIILSLANILYRIIQLKEYAVEDLQINKLKDDLYEIDFLIKNAGYGKLKLDFAFYSIENKAFSNSDDFFTCSSMIMGEYFSNLLRKLENSQDDEMELFLLKSLQKENGVFFTHEGFNTQTRLKKLKPNRLYKVTFFFQTSKKVNYEISKHIIT